jgi:hypothetical protein
MRALRKRGKALGVVAALAGLVVFAAVAFADNVVNDVDVLAGDNQIAVGGSTIVGYKINFAAVANPQDSQAGCNASDGSAMTLAINVPTGVSVTSSDATWNSTNQTLTFNACSTFKYATFSSSTDGTYNITHTITDSGSGQYNNQANWTLIVGTGTGSTNQAPEVSTDAGNVSGPEGSELTNNGAFTDPDSDPLTLSVFSGLGSVLEGAVDGEWTWSYTPNDNGTAGVTIRASDGSLTADDSFTWTANNVAPTITALTPSPANALTGENVTFTGTATDPSSVDTSTGFNWSFNGGAYGAAGTNTYTTSFSTCGTGNTVSALAKDKDGGVSDSFTSSAVSVFDAAILDPLKQGVQNAIKRGQVVPVKLTVGCGAAPNSALSPTVRLVSGDQSASTDTDDPIVSVTTSVSNADTTGFMRLAEPGKYIYNMQIPSNAAVDSVYTVVVRPFGQGSGAKTALVKIRK